MDALTWDLSRPAARRRIVTTVSTVAVGLLVAATLSTSAATAPTALVRADLAVAVAAVTCVALTVRHPGPGAVLSALLVALSPVATPAASFAVLYTARNRPFRLAAAVTVVGVAGEAVQGTWRSLPGLPYGWRLLLMATAYAALLGWGTWARARHALVVALRERAYRAEREQQRRVAEARAGERRRLAREMHDVLAHRLSLLAAYAGAIEYRPDAPPERMRVAVAVIRDSAHQALDELREVITLLRRDDADEPGDEPAGRTLADLPHLVDEARAAGQRVDVAGLAGLPEPVPSLVGCTVYRVVQEALTNARRHAPGQPVTLTLGGSPGSALTVAVRNPTVRTVAGGPGGPPETGSTGSGAGLIGLAERAALAGGRVEHHVDASGWFELTASLPWPAA